MQTTTQTHLSSHKGDKNTLLIGGKDGTADVSP
jgi:hypothetical protein